MGSKIQILPLIALLVCIPVANGWGIDGHLIICRIAQPRLSEAAADAVSQLLPDYAGGDLGSVCSWADRVKFRYHWSSALHYIDTPDNLCTYQYKRDCKDQDGIQDRCVAGAIKNYTNQLLSYRGLSAASQYNLTEALATGHTKESVTVRYLKMITSSRVIRLSISDWHKVESGWPPRLTVYSDDGSDKVKPTRLKPAGSFGCTKRICQTNGVYTGPGPIKHEFSAMDSLILGK